MQAVLSATQNPPLLANAGVVQALDRDTCEQLGFDVRDLTVVECAAALFLERGIAQVKMTDVAARSGVGVATIYRHFETKTRLAIAAGTLMWARFNAEAAAFVETDEFLHLAGADRLEALFRHYCEAYASEGAFMRFLDEFDRLVVAEKVGLPALVAYGRAVDSLKLVFEDAYELGCQDGSVDARVDFAVFYRAYAHALVGLAQKLARGQIIPSDTEQGGLDELLCLVDGAMSLLRR